MGHKDGNTVRYNRRNPFAPAKRWLDRSYLPSSVLRAIQDCPNLRFAQNWFHLPCAQIGFKTLYVGPTLRLHTRLILFFLVPNQVDHEFIVLLVLPRVLPVRFRVRNGNCALTFSILGHLLVR